MGGDKSQRLFSSFQPIILVYKASEACPAPWCSQQPFSMADVKGNRERIGGLCGGRERSE